MSETIEGWLAGLGLGHLKATFAEHQVALRDLPLLTDADLREIGVALGPRRRILNAVSKAREPAPPRHGSLPMDAERRQLTVMFIDLVGSTALAERLDPEDMRDVIRAFQDATAGVVTRFDGFLADYLGDGILAYFGWPRAHEDEAERAGRAGLEVARTIDALQTKPGVSLRVRVGIATGVVVVGDLIGTGGARKNSVVGSTPNLASRLQVLAEPGTVAIADTTAQLIRGALELKSLGPKLLKGMPGPREVFEVVGVPDGLNRFETRMGRRHLPMVGRAEEMRRLLALWEKAKRGEGQAVVLEGEAGIGKSRISRALLDAARPEAPLEIRLQCSPYHTDTAFWPVIQDLRRAIGVMPDDGVSSGETQGPLLAGISMQERLTRMLARAAPAGGEEDILLASLIGIGGDERVAELNLSPRIQRARTLTALVNRIKMLAALRPVLLLVEDTHWIDPTTQELIETWLDECADQPVMTVMTRRPDAGVGFAQRPVLTHIELARLRPEGGREIVEGLAGPGLPKETVDAIVTRTDGVPLFVEELTKAVVETGETSIPASLQDTLMARLDQFHDVKEVAQTASAIGRDFSYRLLAAVTGMPDGELQASLGKLAKAEIIFRHGPPEAPEYSFKHALVLDAAYHSLLRTKRQALHARIFDTLEARFADTVSHQPELLARHATEAHLPEAAAVYWKSAAEAAMQKSANREALGHYNRALAQLAKTSPSHQRSAEELDLQLGLGVASILPKSHGSDDVRQAFARAETLSRGIGDTTRHFRALRGLWHWHSVSGDFAKAAEIAEDLMNLALREPDPVRGLMAHRIMGYTQMTLGDYRAAREEFQQGLALYRPDAQADYVKAHGEDPGLWCYAYLSWNEDWLGNRDAALGWAQEGVALSRRLPNVYSRSFSLGLYAHLCRWRGDVTGALAAADEAKATAEEQGVAQFGAWADIIRGWAIAAHGDGEGGQRLAEEGFSTWCALGLVHVQWRHLILLADICRMRGDLRGALERIGAAEKLVAADNTGLGVADLHLMKGTLLVETGEVQAGEQALQNARRIGEAQGARMFTLRAATGLARLLAGNGRHGEAHDVLAPVLESFSEGLDTADLVAARALLPELV
ncbi:ATP-binding protein [Algicella marina]|uniref:ATP-binding protein n=1 Tax=Algicella marina TaxID=2683284 RepID=UPI00137A4508|nr:adenylate/guanylate cyclase domain-containing protein [Algicella marina]